MPTNGASTVRAPVTLGWSAREKESIMRILLSVLIALGLTFGTMGCTKKEEAPAKTDAVKPDDAAAKTVDEAKPADTEKKADETK